VIRREMREVVGELRWKLSERYLQEQLVRGLLWILRKAGR
jgi:hypothetical protein